MYKKISALALTIVFLFSTITIYAANRFNVINIAPNVGFSISKKNKVDIVVLTDYTGSKYVELQNQLNNYKASGLGVNVDINYKIINNSVKLGVQNSTVPINRYSRYIRFSFTQRNASGYEAPRTFTNSENISYEQCELPPGSPLPDFQKPSSNMYMSDRYKEYQGMGWCYMGREVVFYDTSDYSGTKVSTTLYTQWSNGWDSSPSGFYVREYSDYKFSLDNYWSYVDQYPKPVTSDYYGIDFSKLSTATLRADSKRYVFLISDGSNTCSYGLNTGNYFAFGNIQKSNIQKFCIDNNARLYSLTPDSIKDINIYNGYGLVSSNNSLNQNLTLRQLVNSIPTEGRFSESSNFPYILGEVVNENKLHTSNLIDVAVATDYTGSKLTALNNSLSTLKSNLSFHNYDMQYSVVSGDNSVKIGNGVTINAKVFSSNNGTFWLKSNGDVYYSGYRNTSCGLYGTTTGNYIGTATKLPNISNVCYVASNGSITYFVKNDGTVYYVGSGYFGMAGAKASNTPIQITTLSNIKKIVISNNAVYALNNNGILYGWGGNWNGEFGIGQDNNPYHETPIIIAYDCADMAAGYYFLAVLQSNGYLLTSGYNQYCSLGNGNSTETQQNYRGYVRDWNNQPITNVVKIDTCEYGGMAIKSDGSLWSWGYDQYCQLGLGRGSKYPYAYNVYNQYGDSVKFVDLDVSRLFTIIKSADGSLYGTGYNSDERLVSGETSYYVYLTKINKYFDSISSFSIGESGQIIVSTLKGKFMAWGEWYGGLFGNGWIDYYSAQPFPGYSIKTPIYLPFTDEVPIDIKGINLDAVYNVPLRANSERYFLFVSDAVGDDYRNSVGGYYGFGNLSYSFLNTLKSKGYSIYSVNPDSALNYILRSPSIDVQQQNISIKDMLNSGLMGGYLQGLTAFISKIQSSFDSSFSSSAVNTTYLIAGEDTIDYNLEYSDFEDDLKHSNQWVYYHDETVFENNNGKASFSGLVQTGNLTTFDKVGKYDVVLRMKDNPKNDDRFENYRKLSNDARATIYVHRRPISLFTPSLSVNGVNYNLSVTNLSYDLDHASRADKGIRQQRWQYRDSQDSAWIDGMPNLLYRNRVYTLKLEVLDIDGAWSKPYIQTIDTTTINLIPTVDANPTAYNGNTAVNITVTADDKGEWDFSKVMYAVTTSTTKPTSGWLTSTQKTFNVNINTEGSYYLHMEVYDTSGQSYYRYRGAYTLIFNRPPTVRIDRVNPSYAYESDDIYGYFTPQDPDNQILNASMTLYKDNIQVWNQSFTVNPNNGGGYSQQSRLMMNDVQAGNYRLVVSVTDPYSQTASDSYNFTVYPLGVSGSVTHTALWEQHRIDYNNSKTSNPALQRGSSVFFPGEVFVLNANTTSLDPSRPDLRANSVICNLLTYGGTSSLINTSGLNWSGSIWYESMVDWNNRTLSFEFTATYSNGAVKKSTVNVNVVDDAYWRLHRRF